MAQDFPGSNLLEREPQDEDIDAPTYKELEFLANLLREANSRDRLKGPIGRALKELAEIERRIQARPLSPEERVNLYDRLWTLNGHMARNDQEQREESGPLGAGPMCWRPDHRPIGSPAQSVNAAIDCEILRKVKDRLKTKGSRKTVMREAVKEAVHAGKLPVLEIDSHIKRLERKAKKQGLIP